MTVTMTLLGSVYGEPEEIGPFEYDTIEDANTDLDYLGETYEDLALVRVEGATPEELGFPS